MKMMNQGENMATGVGSKILKPSSSQHYQKQLCEDAEVSINQPNTNSSMSSSPRDKNYPGTAKLPKRSEKQSGSKPRSESSIVGNAIAENNFIHNTAENMAALELYNEPKNGNNFSIDGNSIKNNTFSNNKARNIATVGVYPSQGPNKKKRDESRGGDESRWEADTQSSSDDDCTGTAKLPGVVASQRKNGNNVSVADNSIGGNNFSGNTAKKIATVEKRDESSGEANTQSSSDDKQ